MIVYRTSEKLRVKMGDSVITISPLSHDQYSQIMNNVRFENGKVVQDRAAMIAQALQFSIKKFESKDEIKFQDGKDFKLEWEDGILTKECLDSLYQILGSGSMSVIGTNIAAGTIEDLPLVKITKEKNTPIKKKTA